MYINFFEVKSDCEKMLDYVLSYIDNTRNFAEIEIEEEEELIKNALRVRDALKVIIESI